ERPILPLTPILVSTSTGGSNTYPNSRLWSRASLNTIDHYAATQETTNPNPNCTTINTTTANNIPAPLLTATSYHSKRDSKEKDKTEDDEVMSTFSASSWGSRGSWSSDNTNDSASSFSRSWSYDSRNLGRQRAQGQEQYSNDNYSSYKHHNNSFHNHYNNNPYNHYNNSSYSHYNSSSHNHHNNSSYNHYNNSSYSHYNSGSHNHYNNNSYGNYNNSSNNYYNNTGFSHHWKNYKNKHWEPRNLDLFVSYVQKSNPVPVPLSDRYDGGSCRDDDDAPGVSIKNPRLSERDLIKDGYDDKNENHWLDAKTMVLKDKFPKAHFHALVLPNRVVATLDQLVSSEGVTIVKQLVERGKIIIARESKRSPHLRFKMGFHAVPTMRQVHMHVISTDMDSEYAARIPVYNSYTTEFFLTPDQVIRIIESKWENREFEFLTKAEIGYYNSWIHKTLPWCLECQGNPCLTASASAVSAASTSQAGCLQNQGHGQQQKQVHKKSGRDPLAAAAAPEHCGPPAMPIFHS
ncbi:hypothetical protein BGZ97_000752, partial [Linnemannia gamsii]